MTKKIRTKVHLKYKGRCAYCGIEITEKEMQVDHITPQSTGGTNEFENLNPACKICNHYKRDLKLSSWREWYLEKLIERIRKIYIVRVAERFGMISFHEWDKKFYFEKLEEEKE